MEITFRASLSATVVHGEPQSAASEHLERRYSIIAHRERAGDPFTYCGWFEAEDRLGEFYRGRSAHWRTQFKVLYRTNPLIYDAKLVGSMTVKAMANRHSSTGLNRTDAFVSTADIVEIFIMYEDRKAHALTTWNQLLEHPEIRMTAPEQYDELLRLAEEYCEEGFITREDRRRMIEKATANYRRAVEGLGQGT
jgi:hypothetical protein